MRGPRKALVVRLMIGAAAVGTTLAVAAASSTGLTGPRPAPSGFGALPGPAAPGGRSAAGTAGTYGGASAARDDASGPFVLTPTNFDVSPRMSDIPSLPPYTGPVRPELSSELEGEQPPSDPGPAFEDPIVQQETSGPLTPSPNQVFEGLSNDDNAAVNAGSLVLPSDSTGDMGHDYVEFVNKSWAIYSKTGVIRAGFPKSNKAMWTGFSNTTCRDAPSGDPIALYDHSADRWFLTEFAFTRDGANNPDDPFTQCIAVSTTSDPAGSYYRFAYVFPTNKFNDYGKFGVWSDAYYAAFNMFNMPAGTFSNTTVAAFDRAKMLVGDSSAAMVSFDLARRGLLPSDRDARTAPPVGAPNYFVNHFYIVNAQDRLELRKFHVDFVTTSNSTFTGPTNILVSDFDPNLCAGSRDCIPQRPVTGQTVRGLDPVAGAAAMQRLAYRRFPNHESLVFNHTVNVGSDQAGIRWYELRNPNGTPTVFQQSTWAPDTQNRWNGSIAMDCNGNIALGYSVSSTVIFPSIRYAGRLATDPLNTLQPEATLRAGGGSQVDGVVFNPGAEYRWGDYSSMQVDPADDQTFWYVNQYYPASHDWKWHTRIGSFTYGGTCGAPTAVNVARFGARFGKRGVTVSWRTSSELEVAGFNVWRARGVNGSWRKVNGTLVEAKRSGQAAGAGYRFLDSAARGRRFYTYRLQVVDLNGSPAWYATGTVPSP